MLMSVGESIPVQAFTFDSQGSSLTGVFALQKRRSGRQVKRRKYNEDLDFKVVDDDGETIAVLGAGRTSALSASTLAWQAEVQPLDWAAGFG